MTDLVGATADRGWRKRELERITMTVPIKDRYIVPCAMCGYHYRKPEMYEDDQTSTGFLCKDKQRCNRNRAQQARYKAERIIR